MSVDFDIPLCLFGAGGHGKVVASFAKMQWRAPVCFADSQQQLGGTVASLPVKFQDLRDIKDHAIIVTIGVNTIRETIQRQAAQKGLVIATMIADQAIYMSSSLPGAGTMILGGAIVNVDARIGEGVILNTRAVVEHDCEIGHFCHVAPGAVVLGGAKLGDRVWLGANATVLQGVTIAADCTIGAGSVVTKNITAPGVYVGSPARPVEN